ncbi:cytochrome P450 [Mycena alexandri]|uniref:Cytochrome P450 n=1 Tax=Mycena alexandri TaxID=1745969 RepID=A0AAD6T6U9_9AGAR|nr:cytochrome P450 [Mycena alexandri]KAJ7039490.1 cytochrome P450 [Mycena alexandri]
MSSAILQSPASWIVLAEATHVLCNVYEPQTALQGIAWVVLIPGLFFGISGSSLNLPSVLTSYGYFFCSLSLSILLYRLSPIHPLYHIPGPPLWRITKLIGMYITYTGRQHLAIKQAHDKYGPVIRTGPNEVSIVDVDAVTSVLGAGGLPKGQYYEGRKDPNAPLNLIVLQGDGHANRRRLWNRGMSTESLKEYEEIIAKRATQLLNCILGSPDLKSVDLAAWISYFSFDFMGDMAFGGGFELLANEAERKQTWPIIEQFAIMAAIYCHVPWAARSLLLIPLPARDRLRKFGRDNALRRSKSTAKTKDLWYHLTDEAGLEKKKPTLGDVVADGAIAVVAGADTTAAALASLFFFLLSHSKYYQQLQEEIDLHFPPGADPLDTSSHAEMKILEACIRETLRLHPPVRTSGPRQVGSQGKVIAGVFIPEGTQVYVPPFSLHLDPRYFDNPEKFMPERWIDPSLAPNATAFIPFSHGPSNCVGQTLARQEMAMVACLLLSQLELRFAPGFDVAGWPRQLHDYFITTRGPLMVSVKRRF